MILTRSVFEKCVGVAADMKTREDAIKRITELAMNHPALKDIDSEVLRDRLLEREDLHSTALGDRIAIPHCRLPDLDTFVVGLLIVAGGVDFGAPNDEKTFVFVFIVAPEERIDDHIRMLSQVSGTLTRAGIVDRLLKTPGDKLFQTLMDAIPVRDVEDSGPRNMVSIIVEGEERFLPLLEIAAGIPQTTVWSQTVEPARQFLERIPLFAVFSGDIRPKEYRMITAVVPRSLSNALVRAIDEFCDPLATCAEVMVTVRELTYADGAL